jgi:hypothetical protein
LSLVLVEKKKKLCLERNDSKAILSLLPENCNVHYEMWNDGGVYFETVPTAGLA